MSEMELGAKAEHNDEATQNQVQTKDTAEVTNQNLDLVMDIPVTLSMELGRTSISIQDLLELNSGSVVELQRMADEPMDVLVNGTLVAHGEAVVIGDKFGVRLTDVVSAKECVKRIQ